MHTYRYTTQAALHRLYVTYLLPGLAAFAKCTDHHNLVDQSTPNNTPNNTPTHTGNDDLGPDDGG
jgi:hypothetical protein